MSSKWCLVNKNGDPVCYAYGCRKHTKLREHRGGLFCPQHVQQLDFIRAHLNHAKEVGDIEAEIYWRQQEIEFRKDHEAGHMHWQYLLEKEHKS